MAGVRGASETSQEEMSSDRRARKVDDGFILKFLSVYFRPVKQYE